MRKRDMKSMKIEQKQEKGFSDMQGTDIEQFQSAKEELNHRYTQKYNSQSQLISSTDESIKLYRQLKQSTQKAWETLQQQKKYRKQDRKAYGQKRRRYKAQLNTLMQQLKVIKLQHQLQYSTLHSQYTRLIQQRDKSINHSQKQVQQLKKRLDDVDRQIQQKKSFIIQLNRQIQVSRSSTKIQQLEKLLSAMQAQADRLRKLGTQLQEHLFQRQQLYKKQSLQSLQKLQSLAASLTSMSLKNQQSQSRVASLVNQVRLVSVSVKELSQANAQLKKDLHAKEQSLIRFHDSVKQLQKQLDDAKNSSAQQRKSLVNKANELIQQMADKVNYIDLELSQQIERSQVLKDTIQKQENEIKMRIDEAIKYRLSITNLNDKIKQQQQKLQSATKRLGMAQRKIIQLQNEIHAFIKNKKANKQRLLLVKLQGASYVPNGRKMLIVQPQEMKFSLSKGRKNLSSVPAASPFPPIQIRKLDRYSNLLLRSVTQGRNLDIFQTISQYIPPQQPPFRGNYGEFSSSGGIVYTVAPYRGKLYIGTKIQLNNSVPFFTRQGVSIQRNTWPNLLEAAHKAIRSRLQDRDDKIIQKVGESSRVCIIKDYYKGNLFYSIRGYYYRDGKMIQTRAGFNLLQNQFIDFLQKSQVLVESYPLTNFW